MTKTRRISRHTLLSILIIAVLIPATLLLFEHLGGKKYYISSILILIYMMVPFFLAFEQRKPQARELVLFAVLCALAIASRAAFRMFEMFKPMMAIVMIAGIALGAERGFLCGAITALVSNFLFGQGPWTPWQMFAYGLGGFLAGILAQIGILPKKRWPLAIFGGLCIQFLIGPLLDTCTVVTMQAMADSEYVLAIYLAGAPLNAIHAAATFLTMLLCGEPLLRKLHRVQIKYGMLPQE